MGIIAWICTVITCILSAFKINLPNAVLVLFLFVFVVFVPAFILAKNHPVLDESGSNSGLRGKISLTPFIIRAKGWIGALVVVSLLGTMMGFVGLFSKDNLGQAEERSGKYYIANHGQIVKTISKEEYLDLRATEKRNFLGISLFFYAIPILMLDVMIRWEEEEEIE